MACFTDMNLGFLRRLALLLPFFLLSVGGTANAQAQTAVFERLTQNDGLSNNGVTSLLQDRRGFLWIGTEDGLNRYDGFTFKTYFHRNGDLKSIPRNLIRVWQESEDGTLWVGGGNGVGRYHPADDTFETIPIPELGNHGINDLLQDREGILWIATEAGLFRFDLQTRRTTQYRPTADFKLPDRFGDNVYNLLKAPGGNLLAGGYGGVLQFDPKGGKFTRFQGISLPLERKRVDLIGFLENGKVCVGLDSGGFAIVSADSNTEPEWFDPQGMSVPGPPPSLPTTTLQRVLDPDGTLLVAEDGVGIRRIRLGTGIISTFQPDDRNPDALGGARVQAILRDRTGIYWFGEATSGISKLSPTRNGFQLLRHNPFDDNSLSHNYLRGIFEDRSGSLWVCAQFGGLNRIDRKTGTVTRYQHREGDSGSLESDSAWSVLEDQQGVLWVGTNKGLSSFSESSGKFLKHPEITEKKAQVLLEDRRGTLWVAGVSSLVEVTPDRKTRNQRAAQLGIVGDIHCLFQDQSGRIWCGFPGGYTWFDPVTFEHRNFRFARSEFSQAIVSTFLEDRNGTLWMATKGGGLVRFDASRENLTHFTKAQGFPHDNCYGLYEDAEGRFWISSDAGIIRYEPQTGKIRTFGTAYGVQGREFNRLSFFRNQKGDIFFGGTNGLNIFNPTAITDSQIPPPVAITEFKVNGSLRPLANEAFSLRYDENSIDVGFVALDFSVPQDNRYTWKLDGFDPDWRPVGTKREANYTNLAAGDYVFRVKAANHNGVWNETGQVIRFTVHPPWWRTVPAYTGFVLLGGLLLFGGVKWRLRALEDKNRKLEAAVAERTAEVTRQRDELAVQRDELESKNADILASLDYAGTIQQAILPTETDFDALFAEHFILYRPRDIVSGDFYWLQRLGNYLFLVVADCTGHGVPGAFMSVIGNQLLTQIILERGIEDPVEILNELHVGVQRALKQDVKGATREDGMDIAICRFDPFAGKVRFAGAQLSLHVIGPDGTLNEIRGESRGIGGKRRRKGASYIAHDLDVTGATIILTTDGFADQNSPTGKKFGKRAFKELLVTISGEPLKMQGELLEANLEVHQEAEPQRDDITVVGVKIRAGERLPMYFSPRVFSEEFPNPLRMT